MKMVQFKLEMTYLCTRDHTSSNWEVLYCSGVSAANIHMFSSLSILKSVRLIDSEGKSAEIFVSFFFCLAVEIYILLIKALSVHTFIISITDRPRNDTIAELELELRSSSYHS